MFLPLKRMLSWEQFTEEAVAGPSSMQERHIKDVVYSSVQCHLRTAALVDLIIALESNFRKHINSVVHSVGLGNKLFTSGMEVVSECREVVCSKEECKRSLVFLVKLFNRIRIHHILRTQNRRITQPNQKRNRIFLKITH